MRNYYLRTAVTLGTGLTALFLLVRCTVEEPDYSLLNIGESAGSGGSGAGGSGGDGGSGADGTGGTSAGQGGLGGLGGLGGQGGAPIEPIPCDPVIIDAGVNDAGLDDAGLNGSGTDAGANNPCACIDGFIQAVDADGDGAGTRDCSVAPGLDCDDGDNAVTHNTCGGCTALPNAVGEDCLDCGAYACGGPDTLVCASKPDALVIDPDCQCQDGVIAPRDTDGDGAGTRLCEANPGIDCSDGNGAFITNECGGCESLPGAVGALCNECGAWSCNGTALACVGASAPRCSNTATRQTCLPSGFTSDENCTRGCYGGACAPCDVGTYRCTFYTTGDAISACVLGSSTGTVNWESAGSCSSNTPTLRCNPANGTCTGSLLLPRDQTFDVVPLLERGGLRWHDVLNTASDADYG